jgi:hypothetical protein
MIVWGDSVVVRCGSMIVWGDLVVARCGSVVVRRWLGSGLMVAQRWS